MENFSNKSYEDRLNDIQNNLFIGGGIGQAKDLMYHLMDGTQQYKASLGASNVLDVIGKMIDDYIRIIKYGSFVKVDRCFSLVDKRTYPCLTHNMEFVLRKYGTPEWEDVEFVMPYLDINRANDIINHEYEDLFKRK